MYRTVQTDVKKVSLKVSNCLTAREKTVLRDSLHLMHYGTAQHVISAACVCVYVCIYINIFCGWNMSGQTGSLTSTKPRHFTVKLEPVPVPVLIKKVLIPSRNVTLLRYQPELLHSQPGFATT
jgi:hypothetical protein